MAEWLSAELTRRAVLRGAAGAAGAATLLGIAAVADPVLADTKVSQKTVSYQDAPKGKASCANCALFDAPNSCQTVSGTVAPEGWCKIWRAQKT